MKKNFTYWVLLFLFLATVGFIVVKYKKEAVQKETTLLRLVPRKGIRAQQEEWKIVQANANVLLRKINANPTDSRSLVALSGLFIQEARVTGNYVYYDKAAMHCIDRVLKQDSSHFDAITLKALIQLSQHHFAEGLATAQRARAINPYNAFVYGILVDAQVEMGNYDSAVASAARMIDIRPDIRSYSRIAYLREIHGDYYGAIEAMKLAINAGVAGDETTAWCRVQLGQLYENTGDIKNAALQYGIALEERPAYGYALAGMARIATANKNYTKAISYYRQADSVISDFSIDEALADLYRAAGEIEKAAAIDDRVIRDMSRNNSQEQPDENAGHYSDRELAHAYLKTNNYSLALKHALLEYNRRPDNIDVNETLAWVYYSRGEYEKALPYLTTALRTNSKNPILLCRAGMIYAKRGDKKLAKSILQQVLNTHPNIDMALKTETSRLVQAL
jgi:tetratricopeptide (TPR) repeat protein